MNNVINCRKCGKLFNFIGGKKICPSCKDALEEKFNEVKAYLQKNGKCTMIEICRDCEVEQGQVQQWIREERLEFSDDSPIKVPCESCGKMIGSGKMCPECRKDLGNTLSSMMNKSVPELKVEDSRRSRDNRMRFL